MILLFSDWVLSKTQGGLLGYQYDNLTRELVVQGDLPEGWAWDILVSASGKSDTWPLALGDGQASITLTDDNLSVRGEYYLQLRGTKGDQVRHTNVITAYNSRSLSGAGQWPTLPTEWIQAEKDIKELNAHPPVPGSNGYWLLWDLSSHSYQESDLPVPVGPAGPPNVLEIGTVETLPADQPATASITGESPAQKLNLGIPQGQPGKDGPSNTLEIGTVETLEPGQAATAQIIGEAPNQTLSLGIPRGQTGKTGATPALEIGQVETLEPGQPATAEFSGTPEAPVLSLGIPQGQPGKDGPANTLEIGTVETLEPGQTATAQITGEAPNQTLSLGIPRGQTGKTGATPALEIGQVETLEPGQPATAEFSGTPEKPVLSLGIPQGQPGKDGVQLNDNAVNATEAWSSKKIVDTLCPPFSLSGNPVTCHPVEGYPLSAVVSLEPKQAGTGDPSPENVRPISGRNSLQVTRCGKNLFSKNTFIQHQTARGKLCWGYVTPILPSGQYSWMAEYKTEDHNAEYIYLDCIYTDGTIAGPLYIATQSGNLTNTEAFNVEKPGMLFIYSAAGTHATEESSKKNIEKVLIQIQLGEIADSYEPYQGETSTLTLPETIYGGTVDAVTGEGSKEWGFVEFDGTESWFLYPNPNDTVKTFYSTIGIESYTDYKNALCDRAKFFYKSWSRKEAWCISSSAVTNAIYITIPTDIANNVEEWKAYLTAQASAGTPVQVAYKLATPEPFQATGNQALPAVAGLNTVYTDGDSLDVSGRQDLLYTLQIMQTQTQNLNRFIAEGGTQ